jgi:methionyl-tRNA formyltransferase
MPDSRYRCPLFPTSNWPARKEIGVVCMEFVFAGNRAHVLSWMIDHGLTVKRVFAAEGSYLHRWVLEAGLQYTAIKSKLHLIDELERENFTHFVSCGCPFILPVRALSEGRAVTFVNIHPSLLPDLRGKDPIPGAIFLDRPAGVSCHVMDDGIDTGPVIAQVPVETDPTINVEILYRLSFWGEVTVFEKAFARKFEVMDAAPNHPISPTSAYYNVSPNDQILLPSDSIDLAWRRLRAFSNASKGVHVHFSDGTHLRVFAGAPARNETMSQMYAAAPVMSVVEAWPGNILLKFQDGFLRLAVGEDAPRMGATIISPP